MMRIDLPPYRFHVTHADAACCSLIVALACIAMSIALTLSVLYPMKRNVKVIQ